MHKRDQSGSNIVIILIIISVITLLAGGGLYVYKRNQNKDNSPERTYQDQPFELQTSTDDEANSDTSKPNKLTTTTVTTLFQMGGSLNVTHPEGWEVVQGSYEQGGAQLRDSYIKSAAGNYIHIKEVDGIGGACPLGENTDNFTLTKRINTLIPNVVFSQYSYSDSSQVVGLRLEDHNSQYISQAVKDMKEGDKLTDTCNLFIYPVVNLTGGSGPFVRLDKGNADTPLTYEELSSDPDFLQAIVTLSK